MREIGLLVLGLGSGTAIISTLTTVCLLVALAGALVVVSVRCVRVVD